LSFHLSPQIPSTGLKFEAIFIFYHQTT